MIELKEMRMRHFLTGLRDHCYEQFPYTCSGCERVFEDFAGYVLTTKPVGLRCFDSATALEGPIGTLSMVNCQCGSTISLECADSGSEMYLAFIESIYADAQDHGVSTNDILQLIRDELRDTVLGNTPQAEPDVV